MRRARKDGHWWALLVLTGLGAACGESASLPPGPVLGSAGSSPAGASSLGFGGFIGDGTGAAGFSCTALLPPSLLTRWATLDIDNLLDDAFGPGSKLRRAVTADRFRDARELSLDFVQELRRVALERAANAVAESDVLEVCGEDDAAPSCIEPWLRTWGETLYRRPLTAEQTAAYVVQFSGARRSQSPAEAARNALVSMVLSPYFVFRIELGDGTTGELTQDELATRLSRFASDSAPDAELRALAAAEALGDSATLQEQLHRLWALPAGRAARAREQLSRLQLDRDSPSPELLPELRAEMFEQTSALIDDVLSNQHGTLRVLLTSSRQPLSPLLAEHYGLPAPQGDGLHFVDLEPSLYAGILSEGLFLSAHPSPSRRGQAILQGLLCLSVPAHPAQLPATLGPGETLREQLGNADNDQPCAACHARIDPTGFALEAFDAQGRLTGLDTTGALLAPDEPSVRVLNPSELGQAIANSARGQACAAIAAMAHFLDRPLMMDPTSPIISSSGPPPVPAPAQHFPDQEWVDCLRRAVGVGDFDYVAAGELLVSSPVFSHRSGLPRRIVAFDTSIEPVEHAWQETAQFRGVFPEPQDEQTLGSYLEALRQLQQLDARAADGSGAGGEGGATSTSAAGAAGAP